MRKECARRQSTVDKAILNVAAPISNRRGRGQQLYDCVECRHREVAIRCSRIAKVAEFRARNFIEGVVVVDARTDDLVNCRLQLIHGDLEELRGGESVCNYGVKGDHKQQRRREGAHRGHPLPRPSHRGSRRQRPSDLAPLLQSPLKISRRGGNEQGTDGAKDKGRKPLTSRKQKLINSVPVALTSGSTFPLRLPPAVDATAVERPVEEDDEAVTRGAAFLAPRPRSLLDMAACTNAIEVYDFTFRDSPAVDQQRWRWYNCHQQLAAQRSVNGIASAGQHHAKHRRLRQFLLFELVAVVRRSLAANQARSVRFPQVPARFPRLDTVAPSARYEYRV